MRSVELIYSSFKQIFSVHIDDIYTIGDSVPIPRFREQTIEDLIDEAIKTYVKPVSLIELRDPIVIVGDIHGHFHDLLTILIKNGLPPFTNYLFLGDYVDRGQYSIECITLLLTLRVLFPQNVYLLRGNHEFMDVNYSYGFKDEIVAQYKTEKLWHLFNDVFVYLPYAAIVSGDIFCVHGGISQLCPTIDDIRKIQVPSLILNEGAADLIWSDPDTTNNKEKFGYNQRGLGHVFNQQATKEFLINNNMSCIIRAHQCVSEGVEVFHGGDIISVFSASNYVDGKENKSGFVVVNDTIFYHHLYPIPVLNKKDSLFYDVIPPCEGHRPVLSSYSLTSIKMGSLRPISRQLPASFHVPKVKSQLKHLPHIPHK